jgi:hypothetical protein
MGSGSYSSKDWKTFSTSKGYHKRSTTTDHIYSKRSIDPDLDPKKFSIRESVDSPDNPQSTPIIIGLDVTGSMTAVLDVMARKGLKTICEETYDRKPVTNPHICTLGIGDVECDRYPFQATQFEADIRIFKQLEKIYLERGGGGNNHESYILAWYFAAMRTKTDSFTKRGKKGYIFTIGDEEITPAIHSKHFKYHFGDGQQRTMTSQELFDIAFPEWNIFHVIVKEGSHARAHFEEVKYTWANVIGPQRTIPLEDHTMIGEVIVSAIEVAEGRTNTEVVDSWDGNTAVVVGSAIKSLQTRSERYNPGSLDFHL